MSTKRDYKVDVRVIRDRNWTHEENIGILYYRVSPNQFGWNILKRIYYTVIGYKPVYRYAGNTLRDELGLSTFDPWLWVKVDINIYDAHKIKTVGDIYTYVYPDAK